MSADGDERGRGAAVFARKLTVNVTVVNKHFLLKAPTWNRLSRNDGVSGDFVADQAL